MTTMTSERVRRRVAVRRCDCDELNDPGEGILDLDHSGGRNTSNFTFNKKTGPNF